MTIFFVEAVQNLGGARISTVELASRLSENHDVIIIDLFGTSKEFVELCESKNVNLEIILPLQTPLIIHNKYFFVSFINMFKYFFVLFFLVKKIKLLIKSKNPNYIFFNTSKTLFLFLFLKKTYKIVFYARGWFLNKQIKRVDKFLYKKLVDKFICVSESTRQALYNNELIKLEDAYVIHNAISVNTITNNDSIDLNRKSAINILQAAGFLQDKGIHISILIADKLKRMNIDFMLTITGVIYKGYKSKEYYNYIVKLIQKYNLTDNIKLIVNNTDIRRYFEDTDILIHPSSTEGLGRVIIEAMSFRKPVIANSVGGVTDLILHGFTGYLPQYNNVDEYVNYILLLINQRDVYKFITDNAYNNIKLNYSISEQVSKFNQFLREENAN